MHSQDRQNPTIDEASLMKSHEISALAEDLLLTDGHREGESVFSRDEVLERLPTLQEIVLHSCTHTDVAKWTPSV